ncbi:cytochrome c peroxidase [Emticicia sp. 17c]|uniref:cytochrome c peroxidase n=1 Tax=Emticicia sp. 17c TaxID=3127704 RepID=UPI00301D61A9
MNIKLKTGIILIMIAFLSFKSKQETTLFSVPANFPKPAYDFLNNSITPAGVELGKTLFYDAVLSSDNTISCGSCHQQTAGFTQHGHILSHGVNDRLSKRNAMPLFNLAWATSFGWDGSVPHLDFFAVSPITNPAEMDESMANVLEKLRTSPLYPELFTKAFGSAEINNERFLKALSQFMLTMVSANTRYDRYIRNEGITLNPIELEGLALFKQKCASCHSGDLFTDFSFRNNGLAAKDNDKGRFEITQQETDKFRFKVPSLRNLTYTSPYMHDGRFSTLEQVLEHYTTKVEKTPSLDPILIKDGQTGIRMNADEQQKIIAFLKTLDDEDFVKNTLFSESTLISDIPRKNIDAELKNFTVTDASTKALFGQAIEAYLRIKVSIQEKNTLSAAEAARILIKTLNRVRITDTAAKGFFENYQEKIFLDAKRIIEGENFFAHQFDHFDELSEHFYIIVASFKANDKTLYFTECLKSDMKWLSDTANDSFLAADCKELQHKTLPVSR